MSRSPDEIFLKRFVDYNKVRYSDDPSFIEQLEQLQPGQIKFTNVRKLGADIYSYAYLVDVNSGALFTGANQYYLPARFTEDNIAFLIEPEQFTEEELQNKTIPGIYRLKTEDQSVHGAVLVRKGHVDAPMIAQLIMANSRFTIKIEDMTFLSDLSEVTIDTTMIVSKLKVVETNVDDGIHYYNGEFLYDGTIAYS